MDRTDFITSEFQRLSEKYQIPIPDWEIIPGTVSFFDHDDQKIRLAEAVMRPDKQDIMKYVLAHEFKHWEQWSHHKLQAFKSLREVDAHRAAMDEITGRSRMFPVVQRPTPFMDAVVSEFDSEKFPVKDFCGNCGCRGILRRCNHG